MEKEFGEVLIGNRFFVKCFRYLMVWFFIFLMMFMM